MVQFLSFLKITNEQIPKDCGVPVGRGASCSPTGLRLALLTANIIKTVTHNIREIVLAFM
jgi:hypothetical protein